MVDTDDTQWMLPGVWHKLPTGELMKEAAVFLPLLVAG